MNTQEPIPDGLVPFDLLHSIEGPNPSGVNLRYAAIYDKIKDARREEEKPPPGMSERDRKLADNPQVIRITTDLLRRQSKDLQLAAWLTEALLKQHGFHGLRSGLTACHGLMEKFWDTIYPELEDGDAQARGAPLGFIGTKLEILVKLAPVVEHAPYSWMDYQQSREVGYEEQATTDEARKRRGQFINEGKLTPEAFDKAFEGTAKRFYAEAEKDLDQCLRVVAQLKALCDGKFDEEGPSFVPLRSALESVRHLVHGLLQKKREKEPDPPEESLLSAETQAKQSGKDPARTAILISIDTSFEPPERVEAIRKIAEAAAFLRGREPLSPASYLMLRGLRWGELRAAVSQLDPALLEPPPTELRKHLKRLALAQNWAGLLEAAENAMALPCSRAWLDLQHFMVEACQGLGGDYDAIARAVRSELKTLLQDMPQLLDATLMDDTPAANPETRAWLKALMQDCPSQAGDAEPWSKDNPVSNGFKPSWPGQPADMGVTAWRILRDGQHRKAFEVLQRDLAQQRSGRERFRRKLQLVEMCVANSKPNVAQPILDDLAAAIENHKLDDWEDPEMMAAALATILKSSQRVQADKAQQQKIFERICRLNPAQAICDGK